MRTFFLSAAAVALAFIISGSCSARNIIVKVQDLPQAAQSFLTEHFDSEEVSLAIKDDNEYEVRFVNGWEVEFDRKGQWKKVDCKRDEVPAGIISLIPEAITSYLSVNFDKAFVTEISKDRSGYDIELNNGLDLDFTSKGQLKEIDD